jgi:hypothetical protein
MANICWNGCKIANSDLFDLGKVAFRAIQSSPFFDRSLIHSSGSSMIKKENSYWTVFEKMDLSAKRAKFDLLTLEKIP